jgi:S1-C subfamily serine protease
MRARALLLALALSGCAGAAHTTTAAENDDFVALYRTLHPSIVFFTMRIPADDPKRKGQWDDAYGSGVVVQSGAWGSRVLTDAHVIQDAHDLVGTIGDGARGKATVVARTNDDIDLALVDVAVPNTKPVTLGSSKNLIPGMAIGVLGYPIPDAFEDEHLGRTVSLYTGRIASIRKGALEIDVPIIPGESGGPVFEATSGAVIGIAESRFEEERAIGFATPIDEATAFLAKHRHR